MSEPEIVETTEPTSDPTDTDTSDLPDWAQNAVPKDLKIPPGRRVVICRIRAEWTNRVDLGDRVVVFYGLTEAEENLAADRSSGKAFRLQREMAKQMIRAIDGKRADWLRRGGPEDVDRFWTDIGGKGRSLILTWYMRLHQLNDEEAADFFGSCVVAPAATLG